MSIFDGDNLRRPPRPVAFVTMGIVFVFDYVAGGVIVNDNFGWGLDAPLMLVIIWLSLAAGIMFGAAFSGGSND